MGLPDRILLFLYSLSVAIFAGYVVCFTLPVFYSEAELIQIIEISRMDAWANGTMIGIGVLFILLSLRLIWLSVKRSTGLEPGIDRANDMGAIRISLNTIKEIAINAGRKVKGVHDLTARVYFDEKESKVGIGLKMIVDGKTQIQQLSESLQKSVKNQVETIAGVEVDHVSVYVSRTMKSDQKKSLRVS